MSNKWMNNLLEKALEQALSDNNNIQFKLSDYDVVVGIKADGTLKNINNISKKVPNDINLFFYSPIGYCAISRSSNKNNRFNIMFKREINKLKSMNLTKGFLTNAVLLDSGNTYADTRLLFDPNNSLKLGVYLHNVSQNQTQYKKIPASEMLMSDLLQVIKTKYPNKKVLVLALCCRTTGNKNIDGQLSVSMQTTNIQINKPVKSLSPTLARLYNKERAQTIKFRENRSRFKRRKTNN